MQKYIKILQFLSLLFLIVNPKSTQSALSEQPSEVDHHTAQKFEWLKKENEEYEQRDYEYFEIVRAATSGTANRLDQRKDNEVASMQLIIVDTKNVEQQIKQHLNRGMFPAIEDGDFNAVKNLLRYASIDPELTNENGQTLLGVAAGACYSKSSRTLNPNIICLLIHYRASIHQRDHNDQTALYHAICSKYKQSALIVRILLENHANANERYYSNNTPLHLAAEENKLEIAEMLLSAHADANAVNDDDQTSLHCAIEYQSTEGCNNDDLIDLLLQHGARIDIPDQNGNTPLDLARSCTDNPNLVAKLENHALKQNSALQ